MSDTKNRIWARGPHVAPSARRQVSRFDADRCQRCGEPTHQCEPGDLFSLIGRNVVEVLVVWHHAAPFRCQCSWVGGDPDGPLLHTPTCPACWYHDKRRVRVVADVHRRPVTAGEP